MGDEGAVSNGQDLRRMTIRRYTAVVGNTFPNHASVEASMSVTTEQLAELLAGIVRAQQAIIDAVESQHGGFRNTHLLPKLTVAGNPRLATARLIDIPARVLLRSQGRVPMDVETILRDLNQAMGTAAAAPAAAAAAPAASAPDAAAADDLDFFKT